MNKLGLLLKCSIQFASVAHICKQNEQILLLTSRGLTSPLRDQGVDVHQGHEEGVWLVEPWLLTVIGLSINIQNDTIFLLKEFTLHSVVWV